MPLHNGRIRQILRAGSFVFLYLGALVWITILLLTSLLFGITEMEMTWAVMAVIAVVLLVVSIVLIAVYTNDVFELMLNPGKKFANIRTDTEDARLPQILEELSRKEKIRKPKIVVVSLPTVESFGSSPNDATIVIGKEILGSMDASQLHAVLLHEIFHIKNDLASLVDYMLMSHVFLRRLNLFLMSPAALIIAGITFPNMPFPTFLLVSIFYIPGIVIWILFVVMVIRTILALRNPGVLSSSRHMFFRELVADAYVAVRTNDPESQRKAMMTQMKLILHGSDNTQGAKKPAIYELREFRLDAAVGANINEAMKILLRPSTIKELFDTSMTNRIQMISFVYKMLNEECEVQVMRERHLPLGRTVITSTPEAIARVLMHQKSVIPTVVQSLRKRTHLNIKELANSLRLDPFDLFIILFFLHTKNVIRFKELESYNLPI